uniref:Transposon protein, CACTA, En/Spm sub-class n=1 Tax=Solanum tuberosum TaxID=4113 RepID=M1DNI5_SOLTU
MCDLSGAIGKGRGDGHKYSTMSPSQVHTPFRSFTNHVKKCTNEVETKLPSVDKNTLVLQKENTQTKSPCSTDQVSKPPKQLKQAQIEELLKAEPYLPSIEIVEMCCGPQNRSHVFVFGGGVKAKDMRGGTSSKPELLSELRSTQEKYKSLNEENKSLTNRLSTIEYELKEIRKIKELSAAQQSYDPYMTSPVSFE